MAVPLLSYCARQVFFYSVGGMKLKRLEQRIQSNVIEGEKERGRDGEDLECVR